MFRGHNDSTQVTGCWQGSLAGDCPCNKPQRTSARISDATAGSVEHVAGGGTDPAACLPCTLLLLPLHFYSQRKAASVFLFFIFILYKAVSKNYMNMVWFWEKKTNYTPPPFLRGQRCKTGTNIKHWLPDSSCFFFKLSYNWLIPLY